MGRPALEDDPDPSSPHSIRLPVSFHAAFLRAAQAKGMTWHRAAREALDEWLRRNQAD